MVQISFIPQTLLILSISASISYSIKCFYCSVNDQHSDTVFILPCDEPSQRYCENLDDSCSSIIYNNTMKKGCLAPNDGNHETHEFLELCNQTKQINPQNCKICATDLCNSYKVNFKCGSILILIMALFFSFIK